MRFLKQRPAVLEQDEAWAVVSNPVRPGGWLMDDPSQGYAAIWLGQHELSCTPGDGSVEVVVETRYDKPKKFKIAKHVPEPEYDIAEI